MLRQLVPHSERSNTAVFLEEVFRYLKSLQGRVRDLETRLNVPPTLVPSPGSAPGAASAQPVAPPSHHGVPNAALSLAQAARASAAHSLSLPSDAEEIAMAAALGERPMRSMEESMRKGG